MELKGGNASGNASTSNQVESFMELKVIPLILGFFTLSPGRILHGVERK
ncbi:hypothetical protein Mcup_1114 [Metallosphaera cuprina Ar-4]|uniref:Uncharacterized protein n=1 Tax=Metallosphaera cuprina (strain Ar-4) TaxID=1006006 RepID=F4G321_METCR|nr:hypothetical protein Mcup_1114 [Metallosphaera cuprina Ar-4]